MACWWSGVRWWVGMCKQPLARLSNNKSNCSATGKKLAWTESRECFFVLRPRESVWGWVPDTIWHLCTMRLYCYSCSFSWHPEQPCQWVFNAFKLISANLRSGVPGGLQVSREIALSCTSRFFVERREGHSVAFEGSEAIPFCPIHFCPAAFDLPEAEGSSPPLPQLSRVICLFLLVGSSHRPT